MRRCWPRRAKERTFMEGGKASPWFWSRKYIGVLKDMIKRGQGDWKVVKRWESGEQNEAEEEAGTILQHAPTRRQCMASARQSTLLWREQTQRTSYYETQLRSRQQNGSKIVMVETEKTNSKHILKVELRVLEEEGTMTAKLRWHPCFWCWRMEG